MHSKRILSVIDGTLGLETSSTDGPTPTTLTKGSTSHTTTAMGSQTAEITIQETIKVPSQENENDEKENVPPHDSQEPLQAIIPKSKRSTKRHAGRMKGANNNAIPVEDPDLRTMRAGSTTSRPRKSRGPIPARGEQDGTNTIAGRLMAMRRCESLEDKLARELTVRPLADLSEAYGIAGPFSNFTIQPIVSDVTSTATDAATRQEEDIQQLKGQLDINEAEETPSSHAIIAADLQAALRLLVETTNEHGSLPNALQRPRRGMKRALDPPVTSGSSRANVSNNTRKSVVTDDISTSSRPTKRIRKSAGGCETPKVTSAEPNEEDAGVPRVPQNSPTHSRYITTSTEDIHPEVPVPMPAFDLPDSISEGVLASVSTSIYIPSTSLQDVFGVSSNEKYEVREGEETNEETASSFDTTQGSSRFSSFSELGSLNIEEHFYPPSSPEIQA